MNMPIAIRGLIYFVVITVFARSLMVDKREPYEPGKYRVKTTILRYDPNPRWVSVAWDDEADKPFADLHREVAQAMANPNQQDRTGVWASKTRDAYVEWREDTQNPLALARASAYLGVARSLDPKFQLADDYQKMRSGLNEGWAILRNVPHSYHFARFGYLFNAGDYDFHKYGDLAERLWRKNPNDRGVALATVGEYKGKKPNPAFEKMMFEHLEIASALPNWRATDDWTYALAYRIFGREHKDISAYAKAISRARIALARLPAGFDHSGIKKWIEETEKEGKDPKFSRSEGFLFIDDDDP
ncbi:MAG: hypothetical protein U0S12_05640 [Fimbriimonadales bacterium]